MARLILLNKPYQVLSQFTDAEDRKTLADYISIADCYPAGRLDYDSEGLLILTDDGQLQHQISSPQHKLSKTYFVQVEGTPDADALNKAFTQGIMLKDGLTRPAQARIISPPDIWSRTPPIRERKNIPTSWLEITLKEGKNRQVRRMTAAIGHPTLRLIRWQIGSWSLSGIAPGEYQELTLYSPKKAVKKKKYR